MLLLLFSLAQAETCTDAPAVVGDLAQITRHRSAADPWDTLTSVEPGDYTAQGLPAEVLQLALTAFATAWERGDTQRKVLTVIDYSQPSNRRRLWVLDLETGALLFNTYVAHGQGSGVTTPTRFSNADGSHKSSVGLLVTAETYSGKHGYSLRLDGLESGFNDDARGRAIVIHSANYMTQSFIDAHGRAGRSWGCPALPPGDNRPIIDAIAGGTLVFGYAPVSSWLSRSSYLNP